MEYNRKIEDRRKGPDFWTKWIKWAGFISWIIVFIIVVISNKAKPPVETFFDRYFNVHLRSTWNTDLMFYAFVLLVILFILCIFSIVINTQRHRRKTDRYNKSIILLALSSFIGIIIYLVTFVS